MSSAVGNIHVRLQVDTGNARGFTSAANVISRDSQRMRSALGGTQHSVTALRATMSQGWRSRIFSDMIRQASQSNNEVAKLRASMMALTAITGTSVTGAFAATYLLQTADQANRLNNQLRTVADGEENLIGIRERLYAVSQLTRSDMTSTVTLYARLARAAQEFGTSQTDLIRVTETIQKAFAVGGASQAEAWGGAIQLSQGIASDRFSGEEYRSVSENAPVLLQQMAKHLGVTIGKLREMAHAGELTGKVVTEAILGASEAIDDSFNKTIVTVGQGLTRVGNAFLMYIGESDQAVGVTRRLSDALSSLSENFDEIAAVAAPVSGILLAGLGGRLVGPGLGRAFASIATDAKAAKAATLEGAAATTYAAKVQEIRTRAVRTATAADLAATQAKVASGAADKVQLTQSLAAAQAQRAKAAATMELNRGVMEATGRTGLYNSALKIQNDATRTVLVTQRALRDTEKALTANKALLVSQTSAATAAAAAHNAALAATTVRARAAAVSMSAFRVAMATAQRVGSGLLGMVGGPAGLLFTGAIIGMTMYASNAAKAEERTRKLTKEMHSLGLISDEVAGINEETAESIDKLSQAAARVKLAEINDELERMKSAQNIFERIFGYDPSSLGNMLSRIDAELQTSSEARQQGLPYMTPDDDHAAKMLRQIIEGAQDGSASVETLLSHLQTLTKNSPEAPRWLHEMIAALEIAVPKMEGLKTYAEQTADAIKALNAAGVSTGWVENLIAQEEAMAAAKAGAETLRELAAEQVRLLEMSEDEARLEKIKTDLRKGAKDALKDGQVIYEYNLELEAQGILAAEKAKKVREDAAKAQTDFNDKVADLVTEIDDATSSFEDMQAAATIKRLLDDFATGNMKVETLKSRLAEVNSVNLSDPMDKLIAKIIAAIGPLAQLLGIFNSFGVGSSPLGGDLPGPQRPGGALGRNRREIAAKQTIGQGVLDAAVAEAGLSERDSFIKGKTEELRKQAEALGGVATNAEATAIQLWEMDQAQKAAEKSGKDSADAAKKFADGMADLNRELNAAPLEPFLKEVLSAAEGMGISTDELNAFIAAVRSDGLASAPQKFRDIADAMRDVNAANLLRDISFEQGQLGRNSWDANIFETLRDAGIEVDSVYGRIIDRQMRLTEAMKIGKATFSDTFGGLAKDLMNGVSLTDALTNAMGRMRDRLLDMALDLASSAFTGFLGNMLKGILGGGFSSSITGSSGGYFPGLTGPKLMSFDGGGYTGSGPRGGGLDGKGGFLSLLHPQETVIDHTNGRTQALMNGMPSASTLEVRNRLELEIKGGEYKVESRSSRNDGGINIEQIILAPVKKAFADGSMDGLMGGLYGMKRKTV